MSDTSARRPIASKAVILASMLAISACDQPIGGDDSSEATAPRDKTGARMSVTQRHGIPVTGIELGYGWDTRRSEAVTNHCIEFTAVGDRSQVATLNLSEVSDQSEIMETLNVSAEVKVKTMFASTSAKASFAREARISSSSTNLLLRAVVENGVLFVGPPDGEMTYRPAYPGSARALQAPPDTRKSTSSEQPDTVRLKPWAARMVSDGDIRSFKRHCGDSYVSAIYSGGQVLATISFNASNSATRSKTTAALQASYGAVHAGAKASEGHQKTLGSTNMQVHYLQVGGGRGVLPTSRAELTLKLGTLATEVSDQPVFNEMDVTAYESLPGWNGPPLTNTEATVDDVVSDFYWFLTTFDRDLKDVATNPEGYQRLDDSRLSELQQLRDTVFSLRRMLLLAMETRFRGDYPTGKLGVAPTLFFPASTFATPGTGTTEQKGFRLDLSALEAPSDKLRPKDYESWYENLAAELTAAVPLGNPNTLRLLLPLPVGYTCPAPVEGEPTGPESHQPCKLNRRAAVVNWYVGRQSERVCERNPLDNDCLSREQLAALAELVPTE